MNHDIGVGDELRKESERLEREQENENTLEVKFSDALKDEPYNQLKDPEVSWDFRRNPWMNNADNPPY